MPAGKVRPTVVIVGAGFGGLAVAKALRGSPVRTVLLDRNNYHLFAPLIYQVSTALLDPSDVAEPVRGELRRAKNCEFRQATVTGFDLEGKKVITDVGVVPYDYLVVAAGSRTNFFGNPTMERHALGMKDLTDAVRLRGEVLSRFEAASWVEDGDERRRLLSFVVAGGGSSGVETAGALAELCYHVLHRDFRNFDKRDVSITLLEGSPNVLAPYDPELRRKAQRHLEKLGVRVRRSTRVAEVREREVVLTDGARLPASVVVWTAGVCGSDLARELTAEPTRGQRVPVGPGCNLLGHDDVFVVGDLAASPGKGGQPLPMLAPVATQQGRHVAKTITAQVLGKPAPGRFRYRDKGIMSTIGRGGAVVQVGNLKLSGHLAWFAWMVVHLALIVSPRAQASIVMNWLWHVVSRDRHARAIYDSGMHPPSPAQLAPPKRLTIKARRAQQAAAAAAAPAARQAAAPAAVVEVGTPDAAVPPQRDTAEAPARASRTRAAGSGAAPRAKAAAKPRKTAAKAPSSRAATPRAAAARTRTAEAGPAEAGAAEVVAPVVADAPAAEVAAPVDAPRAEAPARRPASRRTPTRVDTAARAEEAEAQAAAVAAQAAAEAAAAEDAAWAAAREARRARAEARRSRAAETVAAARAANGTAPSGRRSTRNGTAQAAPDEDDAALSVPGMRQPAEPAGATPRRRREPSRS